jgi:hypothetical protein
VAHPLPLFASTSSNNRHRTETQYQDGFAVRALDPALNGRVCRALDQLARAVFSPAQLAGGIEG